MKTLLSALLCFVFLESQVFALQGGPGGTSGAASVIGTYAGILIPTNDSNGQTNSNSLGLFSLTMPATGLGSGTFLVFNNGRTFSGTIQAAGDTNGGEIRGVLSATFDFTVSETETNNATTPPSTSVVSVPITAQAIGSMKAVVGGAVSSFASSATGASIVGTAHLDIDEGTVTADGSPVINESLDLDVDGVQQSGSATTSS